MDYDDIIKYTNLCRATLLAHHCLYDQINRGNLPADVMEELRKMANNMDGEIRRYEKEIKKAVNK